MNGLKGHVGIDRAGAVSDEQAEVLHFARLEAGQVPGTFRLTYAIGARNVRVSTKSRPASVR